MNIINLHFPKTLCGLSGNSYGRKIYSEQLEDQIDEKNEYIIRFPQHIDSIAISFIQGFYYNIIKKYGFNYAINNLHIESHSEELTKKIRTTIETIDLDEV